MNNKIFKDIVLFTLLFYIQDYFIQKSIIAHRIFKLF